MICGNLEKFKTTFLVFNTGILVCFLYFYYNVKSKIEICRLKLAHFLDFDS